MSAIPLRRIEGKYEILEKIREGGMGAIYKVRHRLLDEVRVIKVMRPQLTEDEELKERFLREARLAIKLRHPNIAQLYDFTMDEESGSAFIVMEFIPGTTLEDLLALHGPPPLGLALEIAHQALRALGYLHGKGFVHRDISPDNLMLAEDAEGAATVKLIDLGIAKTLDAASERNLTHTGTFLGKVRYASPEQFGFEGATQADARGDLYSFGVVFYELLTGRYPILGRDPSSIIAGHLLRPPLDFQESDPGGRVPDGLRAVVLRVLAKDPAARFASAQEMSRALAPFRSPDDVTDIDLRRVLSAPAAPAAHEETARVPGSTQRRLDAQFGLSTTPRPLPLELVPDDATAVLRAPDPQPVEVEPLSAALARVEAALAQEKAVEAEDLLFEAEAAHGHQEAFAPLYDRLEALHRLDVRKKAIATIERKMQQGDLDAAAKLLAETGPGDESDPELEDLRRKLTAARRAARLAAAVAEVREHLDRGELAEAAERLDRAVARFGAAETLRVQWERLEALQRQEREESRRRAEERRRREESDPDFAAVLEAVQRIAELLAQRETTRAVHELREATARFGERAELAALRKRLADMVLE